MGSVEEEIRSKEKVALAKCLVNFLPFKKLPKVFKKKATLLIENGILNAAIDKARERNIPAYWENISFQETYSNIGYLVKVNLDPNSSVNRDHLAEIRYFLASGVYHATLIQYLRHLNSLNTTNLWSRISNDAKTRIFSFLPKINLQKLGYMSPLDLNPHINKPYLDELESRLNQTIKVNYSEMYKCSECGARKAKIRKLQTRASDEGETVFITCLNCSYRWKQY